MKVVARPIYSVVRGFGVAGFGDEALRRLVVFQRASQSGWRGSASGPRGCPSPEGGCPPSGGGRHPAVPSSSQKWYSEVAGFPQAWQRGFGRSFIREAILSRPRRGQGRFQTGRSSPSGQSGRRSSSRFGRGRIRGRTTGASAHAPFGAVSPDPPSSDILLQPKLHANRPP